MIWNYLNLAAMIVGYTAIALVILVFLVFIALAIREKYNDWKWRKKKEMEKQASPMEAAAVADKQPMEPAKETSDKPNVQITIK